MNSSGSRLSVPLPASQYFPSRRRVVQACTNCRARKTRCDAAEPRCSLCEAQNVECVYKDSQQPKIEASTLLVLERIQLLEDRLLSVPGVVRPVPSTDPLRGDQASPRNVLAAAASDGPRASTSPSAVTHTGQYEGDANEKESDSQITIPLSHTACANHVFTWPIMRQLLPDVLSHRKTQSDVLSTEATDIFFSSVARQESTSAPAETWRLSSPMRQIHDFERMVETYFAEVNVFFPLLSREGILRGLNAIASTEEYRDEPSTPPTPPGRYCLLLLVLALGDLANRRPPIQSGDIFEGIETPWVSSLTQPFVDFWGKAKLLLGHVSSEITLEAGQCAMLASIYMGAIGQVSDSFYWAHAAAVKCEALAKRALIDAEGKDVFSEAFRRLYWIAFIFEGDFVSEISITLPSGIARYEDLVPHPSQGAAQYDDQDHTFKHPWERVLLDPVEELVGFQISTNATIRRFLNHLTSVVYDRKDHFRMTRTDYANWLLRLTDDLWSYHSTIYRNLPDVLLHQTPEQQAGDGEPMGSRTTKHLGNHAWNIVRLQGRYYAGQYIIHRPFVEYVLLNMHHFESHPCRKDILDRCRLCLEGCQGFINVFDANPANRITGLFASGMVTFTMVMILRIATMCDVMKEVLPRDIENTILVGKRNLKKFSVSVKEFSWHLDVLEKLDISCRREMAARDGVY